MKKIKPTVSELVKFENIHLRDLIGENVYQKKNKNKKQSGHMFWRRKKTNEVGGGHFQTKK